MKITPETAITAYRHIEDKYDRLVLDWTNHIIYEYRNSGWMKYLTISPRWPGAFGHYQWAYVYCKETTEAWYDEAIRSTT